MSQPFALVGTAHPKPERAEELKRLLLSFVEPTRQEAGCLAYHFHEDRNEPGVFVFYEAWRSQADLDAHLALPHMRAFWERRMDYLKTDFAIHFLTMHSPYQSADHRTGAEAPAG
ncbi:putative quinol monooxygenase [Streptomyces sp. NBC_01294]|uniref:putative quinol monooxygenase n=1 Tax=Streptomyces sp. NBC_01294 TaxID=2903815 RepID=UPI002DDC8A05|nr:putative quinol monooxygenase [Streptomyces sp. NBC_01294]WRZ61558.1 antibiotic biosynthesis monooxygenase [Streptomyces sp. NBC_01294]